jgi:hypothetical protein
MISQHGLCARCSTPLYNQCFVRPTGAIRFTSKTQAKRAMGLLWFGSSMRWWPWPSEKRECVRLEDRPALEALTAAGVVRLVRRVPSYASDARNWDFELAGQLEYICHPCFVAAQKASMDAVAEQADERLRELTANHAAFVASYPEWIEDEAAIKVAPIQQQGLHGQCAKCSGPINNQCHAWPSGAIRFTSKTQAKRAMSLLWGWSFRTWPWPSEERMRVELKDRPTLEALAVAGVVRLVRRMPSYAGDTSNWDIELAGQLEYTCPDCVRGAQKASINAVVEQADERVRELTANHAAFVASYPQWIEDEAAIKSAEAPVKLAVKLAATKHRLGLDEIEQANESFECPECGRWAETVPAAAARLRLIPKVLGVTFDDWKVIREGSRAEPARAAMIQRSLGKTYEESTHVIEAGIRLGVLERQGAGFKAAKLLCNVCYERRSAEPTVTPPRMGPRDPIPPQLRFRILSRDGFRCQYCGRSQREGAVLHVDHVHPVAAGGTTDEGNLITACDECNLGKSSSLVLPT